MNDAELVKLSGGVLSRHELFRRCDIVLLAETGCWISLDGLGWELDNHIKKIMYTKANGFLNRVLISHDVGGCDTQKEEQSIQSYTPIFKRFYP